VFSQYANAVKIGIGFLLSAFVWYNIVTFYHYLTDPRKELVKRDRAVEVNQAEVKYINQSLIKDKVNAERKIHEINTNDSNITITNWVW